MIFISYLLGYYMITFYIPIDGNIDVKLINILKLISFHFNINITHLNNHSCVYLRTTQIFRRPKLKLLYEVQSNVLSILLAVSVAWKVKATSKQKLHVFIKLSYIKNHVARNNIRNADLHKKNNMGSYLIKRLMNELQHMITRRQWTQIVHNLRSGNDEIEDEIAQQALDWNPQGTRKRG